MRIISGQYKGRRITAPKTLPARPTTDFAKEALFNILNNHFYFNSIRVLDLFAGIGSIAFEFASRGCLEVYGVENHVASVKFIKNTAESLALPITIIGGDAFNYLNKCNQKFDVIFADPPYAFELEQLGSIVETAFHRELINEDGFVIIEHSKYKDMSSIEHFNMSKKYGSSVFSFFQYPTEGEK